MWLWCGHMEGHESIIGSQYVWMCRKIAEALFNWIKNWMALRKNFLLKYKKYSIKIIRNTNWSKHSSVKTILINVTTARQWQCGNERKVRVGSGTNGPCKGQPIASGRGSPQSESHGPPVETILRHSGLYVTIISNWPRWENSNTNWLYFQTSKLLIQHHSPHE